MNRIPIELKIRCVELYNSGKTTRQIYDEFFHPEHPTMNLRTFQRKIQYWLSANRKENELTLESGTYNGFSVHKATVQVDADGNITQAWIKQSADDINWDDIIEGFDDKITPYRCEKSFAENPKWHKKEMLEIPLFDMHFGVATFQDYQNILNEILQIIQDTEWDEINILFGQDVIHTNDMRGHTAKGTDIGIIDFVKAWNDCYQFFSIVLTECLNFSTNVKLRYSKGNHDECTAWCMLKTLQAKFPQVICDDAILPRKCIVWENCFIGYGHCEYKNSKNGLFRDFVMDFPSEFANSKVREIHCGHLHSESTDDGFMVRRLSSAVPSDKWSRENGYIGSHKRFQLFIWKPNALKSIIYIGGTE